MLVFIWCMFTAIPNIYLELYRFLVSSRNVIIIWCGEVGLLCLHLGLVIQFVWLPIPMLKGPAEEIDLLFCCTIVLLQFKLFWFVSSLLFVWCYIAAGHNHPEHKDIKIRPRTSTNIAIAFEPHASFGFHFLRLSQGLQHSGEVLARTVFSMFGWGFAALVGEDFNWGVCLAGS